MNILGLHIGHDAAACLIKNNRLVCMIEKERISRAKHDRGYSIEMVEYVLGDMKVEELDVVVVSINPKDADTIVAEKDGKKYVNGPRNMSKFDYEEFDIWIKGVKLPAFQVQHHISHIASGYYLSNFDSAQCISYDASYSPEEQTSLKCMALGNKIELVGTLNLNAGIFYDQCTRAIFGDWTYAGKTMGLAAWGKPKKIPYAIKSVVETVAMSKEIISNIKYGEDLAATTQAWLEKDVKRVIDQHVQASMPIVVSGGTALNVVANRLYYDTGNDVFIPPFCTDAGIAVGGALYVLHHIYNQPREKYTSKQIAFLGNDTGMGLQQEGLDQVVEALLSGNAVFWHQGGSEVGPRALTHRSILGRPDSLKVKKHISEEIKGREVFRPIAPIVKIEACSKYFDVTPCHLTDFMLVNAKVLDDRLVGITHVDGTARVQTVSKEFNPTVWKLLDMMEQATGIPVLINTSLNIAGEPICETHAETLNAFKRAGTGLLWLDGEIHHSPS
jgi:carbamoyltransferase